MSKGRKLNAEEKILWGKVSETVTSQTSLSNKNFEEKEIKNKKPKLIQKNKIHIKDNITLAHKIKNPLSSMDQNLLKKLKRGKLAPESKLDLHGLTADQSYKALSSFIKNNYKLNKRLVLVITGKGERNYHSEDIFANKGVLRKMVPQWLKSTDLSIFILDVVQSHIKDGGSGALYVYLKKNKNVRHT